LGEWRVTPVLIVRDVASSLTYCRDRLRFQVIGTFGDSGGKAFRSCFKTLKADPRRARTTATGPWPGMHLPSFATFVRCMPNSWKGREDPYCSTCHLLRTHRDRSRRSRRPRHLPQWAARTTGCGLAGVGRPVSGPAAHKRSALRFRSRGRA